MLEIVKLSIFRSRSNFFIYLFNLFLFPCLDPKQQFLALKKPKYVVDFESVKKNALSTNPIQALDARGSARFTENHIPQSFSTPFRELFNEDKTFKNENELRDIFIKKNVDLNCEMFTSCGSGVTACIVSHALHSLGKDAPVYDGSMTEWKVRAPDLILSDDGK